MNYFDVKFFRESTLGGKNARPPRRQARPQRSSRSVSLGHTLQSQTTYDSKPRIYGTTSGRGPVLNIGPRAVLYFMSMYGVSTVRPTAE